MPHLQAPEEMAEQSAPIDLLPCFLQSCQPILENGKIGRKIENGPRAEMGKRWPKNGPKKRK